VFQWNAKENGEIFPGLGINDFTILVDIPASQDEFPQFYILRTQILDEWLRTDFDIWKNTPGKIKEQRDPSNKRRLFYVDDAVDLTAHGYLVKLKPHLAKHFHGLFRLNVVSSSSVPSINPPRFRVRPKCSFGMPPNSKRHQSLFLHSYCGTSVIAL
jgi:hypothetical protein